MYEKSFMQFVFSFSPEKQRTTKTSIFPQIHKSTVTEYFFFLFNIKMDKQKNTIHIKNKFSVRFMPNQTSA